MSNSQVSGIPGCAFVHTNGFIGANCTYQGALAMAKKDTPGENYVVLLLCVCCVVLSILVPVQHTQTKNECDSYVSENDAVVDCYS